jgi:hypothetical protein
MNGVNIITYFLVATNFGFTSLDVPSGATIDGIEWRVKRCKSSANAIIDYDVRMVDGGGTLGATPYGVTTWGTVSPTNESQTYGGSTDNADAFDDADVRSSSFGLAISATRPGSPVSAKVDHVECRIHYSGGAMLQILSGGEVLTGEDMPALGMVAHYLLQSASIDGAEDLSGGSVVREGDLTQESSILSDESVPSGGAILAYIVVSDGTGIDSAEDVPSGNQVIFALIATDASGVDGDEDVPEGGYILRAEAKRCTPFKRFSTPAKELSPSEFADLTGLPASILEAFNDGVPYWKLKKHSRTVADALGIDHQELKALIARAENQVLGRVVTGNSDSSGPTGYGGLLNV